MQTNFSKKADIVAGGSFCEEYISSKFPIKLSSNPFDSEKDGVFTKSGPFYLVDDLCEMKKSNTWFLKMAVTTPFKGVNSCNTLKCTSGKAHLLFVNYQTEYRLHGKLHPYAQEYWNVVRILRVIDPKKYFTHRATVYEYGRPTNKFRESLCWDILGNTEVIDSVEDPQLADKLRNNSNATAR